MFDNIISLGFFCGVAQELEKIGLRSFSSPFDWIISMSFEKVLELIKNYFDSFFTQLYFLDKTTNQVNNDIYAIQFYHDFKKEKTIDEQLPLIESKYKRRIMRFYEELKKKTLFVRYISNEEEERWINNNYESILITIKSFNPKNDIVFITHINKFVNKFKPMICKKNKDDVVGRTFIKDNPQIRKFFCDDGIYDKKARKANLRFYKKKKRKTLALKIANHFSKFWSKKNKNE